MSIKTPETDPTHWCIGNLWRSWEGAVYFCDSYDARIGFWMTNINDPADRRNISERAPNRTYHPIAGQWAKGALRAGMQYHAVDHAVAPFQVRAMNYDEAMAAPVSVALFAYESEAAIASRECCRRAGISLPEDAETLHQESQRG